MRKATPSEVGGILRRTMGAREAAERIKRMKFKNERRRFGKERELLNLEEVILDDWFLGTECCKVVYIYKKRLRWPLQDTTARQAGRHS